jgi:hypothetical protein
VLIGHLILISSDQFTETKFVARVVQKWPCHLKYVKAVAPQILRHYEGPSPEFKKLTLTIFLSDMIIF